MAEAIRNLFKAPIFDDNRRNHASRLIHFLSLLFITAGLTALVVLPFFGLFGSLLVTSAVGTILLGVVCYGILRASYVEISATILVIGIWLLAGYTIYQVGTINSPITGFYFIAVICAAVLINVQAAALTTLVSILLLIGFGLAEKGGALTASIIPDPAIWLIFSSLLGLLFLIAARAVIQQQQYLTSSEENEQKLAQLNYELTEQVDSLTRRVTERTTEVSQYLLYMQTSMELSHLINAYPDAARLMEEAVDLLQKRFGLYYTGIFQVEHTGQWAILRAGTGETGKAMLARHHQIEVGSGMIGWCISNSRARVAADVGVDAVRLATTELPYTRSEAAVPMRSLGIVTGAITLQSIKPDSFSQELITVLQSYADTLASALENIDLNTEKAAQENANQNSIQAQERSGWFSTFGGRGAKGILYDRISISPLNESSTPEITQIRQSRKTKRIDRVGSPTVLVPVLVRDQVIGVLSFRKPQNAEPWTDREIELLELLAAQLGEAMDNARLYQSIQRQAAREQMLAGLNTRMRETLDVDTVLRTAANEIFQALALEEVSIELAEDEPVLAGQD